MTCKKTVLFSNGWGFNGQPKRSETISSILLSQHNSIQPQLQWQSFWPSAINITARTLALSYFYTSFFNCYLVKYLQKKEKKREKGKDWKRKTFSQSSSWGFFFFLFPDRVYLSTIFLLSNTILLPNVKNPYGGTRMVLAVSSVDFTVSSHQR